MAAAVLAIGMGVLSAAPAHAVGSFKVKVTPYQCTQTDYSGYTAGVLGETRNGPSTCLGSNKLTVKIKLVRGTSSTITKTSTYGVVSTSLGGSGSLLGTHNLCWPYVLATTCMTKYT
ncbi:hypothetical protein AB0N59_03700 [Microbacterium sp. NPDC089321]|uniref:hypothetical protein n=1 Tax=Microbacterium sp. NPDC089321 TaxID=3155183 RepID=UPI00343EF493